MQIGNQELVGKLVDLPSPFAVLEKQTVSAAEADATPAVDTEAETVGVDWDTLPDGVMGAGAGTSSATAGPSVHYVVRGVVRRKLLFMSRPQPIIDPSSRPAAAVKKGR